MPEIKFSKKHELKEDKFIEWLTNTRIKSREHKKPIVIGTAVIIAVAALALFFHWDQKQKNGMADELFGKGMVLFQEGKNQEAVDTLQKIYKEFSGTFAAPKSLFILANLDYQNGNYDNAIKFFEIYESKYGGHDFFEAAVLKGLGSCYEQKKDYKRAVEYYTQIRKNFKNDFSIPEVLLKTARCYARLEMPEKAKEACREILTQYNEANAVREASLLLNSL